MEKSQISYVDFLKDYSERQYPYRMHSFGTYIDDQIVFTHFLLLDEDPIWSSVSVFGTKKQIASFKIKKWKK
jgi:hypothetical protein